MRVNMTINICADRMRVQSRCKGLEMEMCKNVNEQTNSKPDESDNLGEVKTVDDYSHIIIVCHFPIQE